MPRSLRLVVYHKCVDESISLAIVDITMATAEGNVFVSVVNPVNATETK